MPRREAPSTAIATLPSQNSRDCCLTRVDKFRRAKVLARQADRARSPSRGLRPTSRADVTHATPPIASIELSGVWTDAPQFTKDTRQLRFMFSPARSNYVRLGEDAAQVNKPSPKFTATANTTVLYRKDRSAWASTARRICGLLTVTSDTWKHIPSVNEKYAKS